MTLITPPSSSVIILLLELISPFIMFFTNHSFIKHFIKDSKTTIVPFNYSFMDWIITKLTIPSKTTPVAIAS